MRIVAVVVGALMLAAAAPARSPADFIHEAYAVARRSNPDASVYQNLFAPELRALMARDRRQAGGDAPLVDYGPFCQCQDDEGLSFVVGKVSETGDRAVVEVENRFVPPAASHREVVTYRLVRIGGDWKVEDIASKGVPSLLGSLRTGLNGGK
jgi:hypothetical protein